MRSDIGKKIIWSSLKSGLIIFIVGYCLWLLSTGFVLMFFLLIAPGLVYNNAIVSRLRDIRMPILFFLASLAIYVLCYFIATGDHYHGNISPVSIISDGLTGSILLFTCYYFLSGRGIYFVGSLIRVVLFCLISTAPAVVCSHFLENKSNTHLFDTLIMIGILTVFPLWQVLFSVALLYSTPKPILANTYE